MDSANAASAPSPSKSSSLPKRIASAAVLGPGLLLIVWIGGAVVAIAAIAALVLALRELYQMLAIAGLRPRPLVGIACGLLLLAAALLKASGGADLAGAALAASLLLSLAAELPPREREGTLPAWGLTLGGALYIGWLLSHIVLLRGLQTPLHSGWLAGLRIEPGAAWVYTAFGITWLGDTCAYVVGRRVGRHRMTPYLSPNKSWEGAIGGMLGAIAWSVLAVPLLGLPISVLAAVLIGAVGGIAGIAGDLVESLLKRQAGVKDSGRLIPGHGGILDRADSLLFVAPAVYYLALLLAR